MRQYAMPEGCGEQLAAGYRELPLEHIQQFAEAQFLHWTEEGFSSCFRRMLTLEQYRDPAMARLLQQVLAAGPLEYVTALLSGMTDDPQALALTLYGPMFLLYSVYDDADDNAAVLALLDAHLERWRR